MHNMYNMYNMYMCMYRKWRRVPPSGRRHHHRRRVRHDHGRADQAAHSSAHSSAGERNYGRADHVVDAGDLGRRERARPDHQVVDLAGQVHVAARAVPMADAPVALVEGDAVLVVVELGGRDLPWV